MALDVFRPSGGFGGLRRGSSADPPDRRSEVLQINGFQYAFDVFFVFRLGNLESLDTCKILSQAPLRFSTPGKLILETSF